MICCCWLQKNQWQDGKNANPSFQREANKQIRDVIATLSLERTHKPTTSSEQWKWKKMYFFYQILMTIKPWHIAFTTGGQTERLHTQSGGYSNLPKSPTGPSLPLHRSYHTLWPITIHQPAFNHSTFYWKLLSVCVHVLFLYYYFFVVLSSSNYPIQKS